MSDSNQNRKEALENEAQNYIRLGTLMRRARPDDRAEAVAQVLADSVPIEEKIRRIERIDSVPISRGPRKPAAPRPPSAPGAEPQRVKQTVAAAARRRAHLKAEVAPSSFMQYFFREGMEIRKRAKGNGLLKAGLFSVALEEAATREFLDRAKKELVPPLISALGTTLREGWRFLRKSEYNRLAALNRLVTELNNLDLQHISPHEPGSAKRMFPLESAFLYFRVDPSIPAEAVMSLDEVLAKLSHPRHESEEAYSSTRRLLQNGGPPACLQDFVLAFNMVRTRRYLSVSDLMRVEPGPLVSLNEFDCSEGIQDKIDSHIASLLERLDKIGEENEKVTRLRTFVTRDKDGNIDYGPLAAAYEAGGEAGPVWKKDEDNAILVATGLAERLVGLVVPLLGNAGAAAEAARRALPLPGAPAVNAPAIQPATRIEDKALLYRISLMQNVATKLRKMLATLPNLPQVRFLAIKARAVQATKFDADGAALIGEAADLFYMIASRLADLLLSSDLFPVESPDSDPPAPAKEVPLPSLDNIALRQSLSTAATLAYLAALRFQEPTMDAALKNDRQADDQRRDILGEIERLSDADTFQEARRKAGLHHS
ncbi:MAG TPA: hypothetical protein VFL04_07510 [Rectinemataceae bacterium]|nr:hypothetical protein [Rectinemataceae bacterium]